MHKRLLFVLELFINYKYKFFPINVFITQVLVSKIQCLCKELV